MTGNLGAAEQALKAGQADRSDVRFQVLRARAVADRIGVLLEVAHGRGRGG
jgi:hypothetical protein